MSWKIEDKTAKETGEVRSSSIPNVRITFSNPESFTVKNIESALKELLEEKPDLRIVDISFKAGKDEHNSLHEGISKDTIENQSHEFAQSVKSLYEDIDPQKISELLQETERSAFGFPPPLPTNPHGWQIDFSDEGQTTLTILEASSANDIKHALEETLDSRTENCAITIKLNNLEIEATLNENNINDWAEDLFETYKSTSNTNEHEQFEAYYNAANKQPGLTETGTFSAAANNDVTNEHNTEFSHNFTPHKGLDLG